MYELLSNSSKQKIEKENFIKRNKNIYEGIEAKNITIEIGEISKNSDETQINYNIKMNTVAGDISLNNKMNIIKEDKQYKINWSSNDIFPELNDDDKIRVKTTSAKRGEILDRNGKMLAGEGTASSVGLVPGKMQNKDEDIKKIANLLDISTDTINKELNASYVKDDTFVPLKTVAKSNQSLKDSLLQIKGIKIVDTKNQEKS